MVTCPSRDAILPRKNKSLAFSVHVQSSFPITDCFAVKLNTKLDHEKRATNEFALVKIRTELVDYETRSWGRGFDPESH